ncbi:metal-dependent hydrolase of the beta-lactamase superfamily transporter III [Legionella beliardensis]|uniref:Metal-dependent hydrolase of the beta-lactamase superfamily transporter III n=1 Tax=Legionella beliardensis TaxID=91822 RepID=A0A378I5W1_9GAMM|nr:MBL fold metallo-hydrolase [Legionella beliardensis]STX30116.1 metal-dependent hydrolase of the beta-lactamase superfamily transporter III [Legionella beliardensis]
MSLKMTFLGTGAAFTLGEGNFQSNVLLESNGDSLLLDAGSDLRFSLFELNRSYHDIRNVYISHLHNDHIGGLEWLALTTFFDKTYQGKPMLFISERIVDELWDHSLSGGLNTLTLQETSLDTYFNVHAIQEGQPFSWQDIRFKLIQVVHVYNNDQLMPCYGLLFSTGSTRIFFSTDSQYNPYLLKQLNRHVDLIFHDCETQTLKTGVHAHYTELKQLPAEIKKKMWLYHYNPGTLPDAKAEGFLGFVCKGQCFNF